jgi:putative serine protease PepD
MSDETTPIEPAEQPVTPVEPAAPAVPEAPAYVAPAPTEPAAAPIPSAPAPAFAAPAQAPAPAPAPYIPTPDPRATQPPVASSAAPASHGGGVITVAVIAALFMGAIAGVGGGYLGGKLSGGSARAANQTVTVVPSTTDEPVIGAAAAAVPSIVNIDITGEAVGGDQSGLPSDHQAVPLNASGSGVAFKKVSGGGTYILTNNHVVDGAKKITVSDTAGNTSTGTLVGRDPDSDIAVVRIAEDLPVIEIGDSTKLIVGQTVVAIGSPFGFQHSVTSGVVSALGRSLTSMGDGATTGSYPLVDVIQTDAAINPGNSGGALVDRAGKLIGVNTAIYANTGSSGQASSAGIGFAIPVSTAARVAGELIEGGKVSHPFIGLVGTTVTSDMAAQKKLPVTQGALVVSLTPGSGAEKANVKLGDVVTEVDGTTIRTMDDLITNVRRHAVGDTVKLTVRRGTETLTIGVVVGDKPANLAAPSLDSSATTPTK